MIQELLELFEFDDTALPPFPPTDLYNEGWLLRMFLGTIFHHRVPGLPVSPSEGSRWFSGARLPTAFRERYQGDRLGEKRTVADGVLGHFGITGKTGFNLLPQAGQFVVAEAKVCSILSTGIENDPEFDQAARSVSCMAEALRIVNRAPAEMQQLGFYVFAPQSQIDRGAFSPFMERDHIASVVKKRVGDWSPEKNDWFDKWFAPTFAQIRIELLGWEGLVERIRTYDAALATPLEEFYERCKRFGAKKSA